jgi:hypothetical protein
MSEPMTKVDSAIEGLADSTVPTLEKLSISPTSKTKKPAKAPKEAKVASPTSPKDGAEKKDTGVMNINDLESQGIELKIDPNTQTTGWKINTSSSTVEDKEILKKLLTTPPVKKIDLEFSLGSQVTARNLKGVTIKDALDAIHKQYKKRSDDEMDEPYLKGFEWDKDESWTRLKVHLSKNPTETGFKTSKKSKKAKE